MTGKPKIFEKRETILLIIIFTVATIFYLINQIRFAEPATLVEISVIDANSNKTILETFDLSENTEYTIVTEPPFKGEPEGTNHLIIQDGSVWISEANCPNHDCVKKGKISQNGEMLVCIPHRVTVTVVDE